MTKKEKILEVYNRLISIYGEEKIALNYSNTLELLIAVVLSAQCTDIMVNKVTEILFKKYKKLDDYINADIEEFKNDIKRTGFFNNKAKNILETCKKIKNNYKGKVPNSMSDLIKLNGVGRKTANIILSNAFNITDGIAVDTHMLRINYNLGLTSKRHDPIESEKELMKILPKGYWNKYTYLIIKHGRDCCKARLKIKDSCILKDLYKYNEQKRRE